MPFDYEAKANARHKQQTALRIGIVGFGTFGQFLAKRLISQGHKVIATSRGDYFELAQSLGVHFFQDADDFAEEHPEVVILASSILSTEAVLNSLPVQRLKRSTLFVDVLSVKEFPKRLFLAKLPAQMDILCTHPMFGPDSGSGSWNNLNFMYEKVRIGAGANRRKRFFEREGCKMVEMSCEEHDRQAASTQFITHTVGRVLGAMELQATPIDTRGFKSLLDLVSNTTNDSFELYYGLFMYNQAKLERLGYAFDAVKKQLLARLHELARKQIGFDAASASSKRKNG
ncbi:MAG: arogenate prephenate dehydrogenase, partial [Trebouxia sp. A1-2]